MSVAECRALLELQPDEMWYFLIVALFFDFLWGGGGGGVLLWGININ